MNEPPGAACKHQRSASGAGLHAAQHASLLKAKQLADLWLCTCAVFGRPNAVLTLYLRALQHPWWPAETRCDTCGVSGQSFPAGTPRQNQAVEGIWSVLKRGVLANLAVASFGHLVLVIRHGLKKIQYRPGLIKGCLAGTGLTLDQIEHPTDITN
jgi:hypothetical protein